MGYCIGVVCVIQVANFKTLTWNKTERRSVRNSLVKERVSFRRVLLFTAGMTARVGYYLSKVCVGLSEHLWTLPKPRDLVPEAASSFGTLTWKTKV